MTQPFPDNPFLSGMLGPSGIECDAADLIVEGELPKDLVGCYYRNGPDPVHPPREGDQYHWFHGDGMIQYFRFENGRVSWRNRWVQTQKYLLEREAGQSLFGVMGNPMMADPSVAAVPYNTANTSIVKHAGKMLALMEGALPVEIAAHSLETIGDFSYDGQLKGPFTAHPKFDNESGEMVFFGYHALGMATPEIRYNIADKNGKLIVNEMIVAPWASMVHDFVVTKNFVVFPIFPITFNIERAMEGGLPMAWEPDKGSQFGVMPRYGKAEDVRWYSMDARFMFHMVNAWDDGDNIVIEVAASDATQFAPMLDGSQVTEGTSTSLRRWTIDTSSNSATIKEEKLDDLPCEFPRTDDRFMMQENRHHFAAARLGEAAMFNAIVHYDRSNWQRLIYSTGDTLFGEPVIVPRQGSKTEADGYLLVLAYNELSQLSELHILEALSIDKGPVATVKMPLRIPAGFHGVWIED